MYRSPFSSSTTTPLVIQGVEPATTIALRQNGSHLYVLSKYRGAGVVISAYLLGNLTGLCVTAEKRGSAVLPSDFTNGNIWCSFSGLYAIVSLYDEHQSVGENYAISVLSKKQRLHVSKMRGIELPITALSFVHYNHPIWTPIEPAATVSTETDEKEGVHSAEFLFTTSDNHMNVGQICNNVAKIDRKTKVTSISNGPILGLHMIPINYKTIDAAWKIGMQSLDGYGAPGMNLSRELKSVAAYTNTNIFLTLVCARGLIKAYLHTVYSLFDLIFSSKAEISRFTLTDAEVLQHGPLINTTSEVFYFATNLGLIYQVVSQCIGSRSLFLQQYRISLRKILETSLWSRVSTLLKMPLKSQEAQDLDVDAGYAELRAALNKCNPSSFSNFVIDVKNVRGFDPCEPVLLASDEDDDQASPPGALLKLVAFNYHTVIITANKLLIFNPLSQSQVASLQHSANYNSLLKNPDSLTSSQLARLYVLLQNQFIYSGTDPCKTFPVVTDSGALDLSSVVHFYMLMSYGSQSKEETTSSSLAAVKINVVDEAVNMWLVYYALHDYEKAIKHCQSEEQRRIIKEEYAKRCLASGETFKGARLLAETNLPLLDIYRECILTKQYEVAVLYLEEKLLKMPARNTAAAKATITIPVTDLESMLAKDNSQSTRGYLGITQEQADQTNYQAARKLLVHMLIEAIIFEVDARAHDVQNWKTRNKQGEEGAHLSLLQAEDRLELYKEKLKQFICTPDYSNILDFPVLQSSLLKSGLDDIFTKFCKFKKDGATLLRIYIVQRNYKDALQVLSDQNLDLFYYYSGILLNNIPHEFLEVIRKKTKREEALAAEGGDSQQSGSKGHRFMLSNLTQEFVKVFHQSNPLVLQELVSFFQWLLIDQEGSIQPTVNTFAFEFLAKANREDVMNLAISVIPADYSVDTSTKRFNLADITSICRRYGFKDCEAKCLAKTGNQLNSLELSLSLNKKIALAKLDFGEKEACLVTMIKEGDIQGALLSRALSSTKELDSAKHGAPLSTIHASLPDECESLILSTLDLIEKTSQIDQKRQLLRILVDWLTSMELVDPTNSLEERGWTKLNTKLTTAQIRAIVEMVFKYIIYLRITELLFEFTFTSLSETVDLLLSTKLGTNIIADSLYLTFCHYQERSTDIKRGLDKCVNQIEAKKYDLKDARQRVVTHEGLKMCSICLEYLDEIPCLTTGLGIHTLARTRYGFLMNKHTFFFCGHIYHTCCLAFYLSALNSRINKLIRDCENALQGDAARPTGLIDKVVAKLASGCPICSTYGIEEINTDICSGIPLLLKL